MERNRENHPGEVEDVKPVLVTGGCGFVGRHLVLRLLQLGRVVWIVDDLSTGRPPEEWVPAANLSAGQVVFIRDDVRNFFRSKELPEFGDVFHLAAVVGGRAKIERDPLAVAQDLAIDAEFFWWAARNRPERILYTSSSAAYPIALQTAERNVALREDLINFAADYIGRPDMTYGWAKLTGEYLARLAAEKYGLRVACIRPFSGYGEDQDVSYPIPAIARRAARKEDPLVIWGSGTQGRDFVYIEDCVDAMLKALEVIHDGSAVNIGTGRLTTFREVAEIFAEIAGYRPKIQALTDAPEGVHARYADITMARTFLKWEPRVPLREGLRRVYEAAVKELRQ